MTLRLRLILAIVVLVTTGLGVFGVVTYVLYSRSQYDSLDESLRAALPPVTSSLVQAAGLGPPGPTGGGGGGRGAPPVTLPPSVYAELRDAQGAIVETVPLSNSEARPTLDETIVAGGASQILTDASGEWRVLVAPADRLPGGVVVVAVPLTGLRSSLENLVLIEALAALGLLTLLAGGSYLILRHGLRPLEHMATSARSISAGDLSPRVEPSDDHTEVGQLGLALNTMLDEIQDAFLARDATERRLRQFLSDASHELRTPLTSIQGFAELFRIGEDNEHVDLEVIMRRIEQESARMKVLVEDLLLLARLDETRPVEHEPVDLAVLAADACSDAVAGAPDRAITLDAPHPVVVACEADHVRQAIGNLVTNALRHTPPGTPVHVATRLDGGFGVVTVRDAGPGLSDEALEHAFDRFWQADRARVGAGSGLGLSIVAGIAAEHAGTVTVANDERGGAVFTLRLPAGQ